MNERQLCVLHEQREGMAILQLNRPERRNVLDAAMRTALVDRLNSAYAEPKVEVILIEGDSRAFCAGGELSSMTGMTAEQAQNRIRTAHALPRLVQGGPKPVIAVVEGVCAGAGLGLASVCDLIVAGENALFVTAFEKVGLMPDFGVAWAMAQRMGAQSAKRLLLLGAALAARQAEAAGLCDVCVAAGTARTHALELAGKLRQTAPATRRAVREVFRDMPLTLEDVLAFEADRQAQLYRSKDAAEGIAAFREKRRPVWRDA